MKKHSVVIISFIVAVLMLFMVIYTNPTLKEAFLALWLRAIAFISAQNFRLVLMGLVLPIKKFLFSLTFVKVISIGVQRFFIDHFVSKNLKNHFFNHLSTPLKKAWSSFDSKKKVLFFVPFLSAAFFIIYFIGVTDVINILGIKTLTIGFFKGLWIFSEKVFTFFTFTLWHSWISPLLQVILFSWILALLEKIPAVKIRLLTAYAAFYRLFRQIRIFILKYIGRPIKRKLNQLGKSVAIFINRLL